MRCDRGDFESTGDAAACDAASAEGCGGSASRALASASISGCGVGLRPIFATPAVKSSALAWMRWRRAVAAAAAASTAPEYGWHSWEGCFALLSLLPGVGWRFGLGALGPWIGDDVRRSDSGAHTAQQQGSSSSSRSRYRRRQETQCTGEADLAGDAVPQLCRECWKSRMEMAKGQAGGGRRDER